MFQLKKDIFTQNQSLLMRGVENVILPKTCFEITETQEVNSLE